MQHNFEKELSSFIPVPRQIKLADGLEASLPAKFKPVFHGLNETDTSFFARYLSERGWVSDGAGKDLSQLVIRVASDLNVGMDISDDIREQAYIFDSTSGNVEITAGGPAGLFYGLITLGNLISGGRFPRVRISDWPDMPVRGVHFMLGVHAPSIEYMRSFVDMLSVAKMNCLVLEYDDRFPFIKHSVLTSPMGFTELELRGLDAYARERFVEIVPLLDSLGHMNEYLCHEKYEHLREMPGNAYAICPSNPESLNFVKELWSDVLALHDKCRFAHVTGDEIFGRVKLCPACSRQVDEKSKAWLFGNYYRNLCEWLLEQGRRPIMWSDTVTALPDSLEMLPRETIMHYWHYWPVSGQEEGAWEFVLHQGAGGSITPENLDSVPVDVLNRFLKYWKHPVRPDRFKPFPYTDYFMDNGFEVFGGPACSSEEGVLSAPTFDGRIDNAKYFAAALAESRARGIVTTFWNGRHTMSACLTGVMAAGAYGWNSGSAGELDLLGSMEQRQLKLQAGTLTEYSRITDPVNVPPQGYVSGEPMIFPDSAKKTRDMLNAASPVSIPFEAHRDVLDMVVEQAELFSDANETFRRVGCAFVGKGEHKEIDLSGAANIRLRSMLHMPAAGFDDMERGTHTAWGVPFNVMPDDPDRGGVSGIALYSPETPDRPRKVSLSLDLRATRIFFLHSCAYAWSGANPMTYRFCFEDDTEADFPVVVGDNILGWSSRTEGLPNALEAWHGYRYGAGGAIITAYLSWWDNPVPDKKICSFDIIASGNDPGYGMLIAATARTATESGNDCGFVKQDILDRLLDHEQLFEALRGKFEKIFRKTMTADNARAAADYFVRFNFKGALDACRRKVMK